MGKSSGSVLELKLMNCKDLQAFNFFQKLSVYAVASLISDDPNNKKKKNQQQQQQRTPTDNQGDKDPEWNHEMRFNLAEDDCDDDHLFLHFDLRSELALFGDKSLGEVRVLLKDLVDEEEESRPGIVRFVSYEVRTSDKKPNGILNFSYKLQLMNQHNGDHVVTTCDQICNLGSEMSNNGPIDGYPTMVDYQHHDHHNNNNESYYCAPQSLYPSLEMPYPPPPQPPPGESCINYPQPHNDLFHSQLPPPPPPVLLLPSVQPLLSPPPFSPPPPPFPFPFPPPPPPHHHHHHHYPPLPSPSPLPLPLPWGYAQSYPGHEPPNPLEYSGDYAYCSSLPGPYYSGDPKRH